MVLRLPEIQPFGLLTSLVHLTQKEFQKNKQLGLPAHLSIYCQAFGELVNFIRLNFILWKI